MVAQCVKQNNIIWDLGNTLLAFRSKTDQDHDQKIIVSFLACFYGDKKTLSHLECKALSILEKTGKQTNTPEMLVLLPSGHPAPEIICSSYAGTIIHEQAVHKVMVAIKEADNAGGFKNQDEKKTIEKMLIAIFDSVLLGRHLFPIAAGLELVAQCAKNPKNRLFTLSNMDPDTFTYFYGTLNGKAIFRYFDSKNICISGNVGFIKPRPEIYNYFLFTYHLEPSTCIFIDNQPENFYWPRQLGISCLELKDNNYSKIKADLIEAEAI